MYFVLLCAVSLLCKDILPGRCNITHCTELCYGSPPILWFTHAVGESKLKVLCCLLITSILDIGRYGYHFKYMQHPAVTVANELIELLMIGNHSPQKSN